MWWIDLRSWIESIRINTFITFSMGVNFFSQSNENIKHYSTRMTNLNIYITQAPFILNEEESIRVQDNQTL